MDPSKSIFHLAIPCRDLDEAKEFYVGQLGCRLARRYDDRITLEFFGDQVVCHLSPQDIDSEPTGPFRSVADRSPAVVGGNRIRGAAPGSSSGPELGIWSFDWRLRSTRPA